MKKKISNKLLAIVLVLGVLISLGSFVSAKYISEKNISNSAQVAMFDVKLTGDTAKEAPDHTLEIDGIEDGPTVDYEFTVTSNSEVKVSADLTIELDDALPDGVTMKLEDTSNTESIVEIDNPTPTVGEEKDGKTKVDYVYTAFASFEPGSEISKSYKLSFIGGDHGSITESKDIAVSISVTASQVQ